MRSLKKLVTTITNSKKIVVATHRDPDGDGIAAALACAHLIKYYKHRKPVLFCHSKIPLKYQFLLRKWQFTRKVGDFDLLVAVDSAGISRIFPRINEKKLKDKAIINIDHHRSNTAFGRWNYIDPEACACAEQVYSVIQELGVRLTTEEAETHPVVKEKFLKASSRDTIRSRSLTGKPARQLRNAWTEAWNDPENPDPLPMPLQPRLVREARERISRTAHKSPGAEQLINYFVGQVVGSMNHVKSVRSVIEEMVSEYADTMERLDDWAES